MRGAGYGFRQRVGHPAGRLRRATDTAFQPWARRALIGSAIQMGMTARAAASSSTSAAGEPGQERHETLLDIIRAKPGQGADDLARLAARRRQLPAGSVTQFNRDAPELQPPTATRGEMDLADGVLGGQAQPVGRGAAAGDDGLAPELGERFERLADARRTGTEAGLDGMHVDALTDAHQPPGAGVARQCLVHRCALAQVKEGGGTDRRRLGQSRGMLHDAFRKAGHGPVPKYLSEI